jgi:RHS repeat-associated protein
VGDNPEIIACGYFGAVFQVVNNRDTTRTVNYTYDALNRITSGFTTSNRWGDNYVIDGWGNLYQKNAYAGKLVYDPLTQIVSTKNQFVGMCYDKAGNLLGQTGACPASPPYTPTYTYDAENRLTTTGGVTYTYDGDGKRVKKSNGTLYWMGMGSDALDETDLAGSVVREYIYFNGKRVARLSPSVGLVRYFFSDHLGSHDIVTNSTGAAIQEESDYGPYGEERVITDTLSESHKFTGKERDSESGLDEFGARYYSSPLGRFMTPDWSISPSAVPYADFSDPQSINQYGYVRNNPLSHADADGHDGCPGCSAPFVLTPEAQQFVTEVGKSLANAAISTANFVSNVVMLGDSGAPQIPQFTVNSKMADITGTALSLAIPLGGEEAAAAKVGEEVSLATRAGEIHGALDPIAQSMRTTAVGEVTGANGAKDVLVSSSERALTPAQRGALQPGETAVSGAKGVHAEQKILDAAKQNNQAVNAVAASRNMCANCQAAVKAAGAKIVKKP